MRMDAATVTIVGRAGTNPMVSASPKGDRVTFRVISTERRFDEARQDWVDGDEYGVSVVCWRGLASAVLTTVRKGDPIVVIGRISTRKYEKNGGVEYFTDVKGDFVGLDVAKLGSRFSRSTFESRDQNEPGSAPALDPAGAPVDPAAAELSGEASDPPFDAEPSWLVDQADRSPALNGAG
ncbi:MAG TPA: single-stranded DNA-binding protein [Nakamurella sp.]